MSVSFSGALRRSGGVVSAIGKQLKGISLKGISRINVQFDPFAVNVKSTRELLFLLSTPKVVQTNPKCIVKANVVCNRSPTVIKFSLTESAQENIGVKEIHLNCDKLNLLELLQLCNKHISTFSFPEDFISKGAIKVNKLSIKGGVGKTSMSKRI